MLGIRSLAKREGCAFECLPGDSAAKWTAAAGAASLENDRSSQRAHSGEREEEEGEKEGEGERRNGEKHGDDDDEVPCLFAFPAECNFSGSKFDLSLIDSVRKRRVLGRGKWLVSKPEIPKPKP